ncbi:MAG: hypothetical protein IMF10_02010 [Proteobacteria bacterium]|nr:hypothetical protein [Pseudomonadota bacterium]
MFKRIFILLIILLVFSPHSVMGADAGLNTIKLEAGTRLLQVGSRCFLKAVGRYEDGSERDITGKVEWVSVNHRVGRFVGKGVLMGEAVGSTLVFVRLKKIRSGSIRIQVQPATQPVLKVSPREIDLGNVERNKSKELSISIRNIGMGDLRWEVRSDTSWLVPDHDLSRDAYDLWLKTQSEQVPYNTWKDKKRNLPDKLTGRETDDVTITAYTVDLPDGEHKGTIIVTSGVERREIEASMKVVSLEYISITPVSIKIRPGQRRRFRAVGIWSDGSRTDLSEPADGQWVVSDPYIGGFLYGRPVFVAKDTGETEIRKIRGDVVSDVVRVVVEEGISRSVLAVSPREVDLGAIGPGESSRGDFFLKNFGSGFLNWSVDGPSGWSLAGEEELSGVVRDKPGRIRVHLRSLKGDDIGNWEDFELYPIQLRIESGGRSVSYVKGLPAGSQREMIKLTSDGGMRRIFLKFEIAQAESAPSMKVGPLGMDAGVVESGKQLVRRIKLVNKGGDILKWKARLQRNRKSFAGVPLKKGRYVSLLNKNIRGKKAYMAPARLKDSVDISGVWSEDGGYPCGYGNDDVLKYSFSGTGIALFIWKDFDGGDLAAHIDDRLVKKIDCYSQKKERAEILLAEGLEEGPHVLTLVNQEGHVAIEGMRVYSKDTRRGGPGWIRIFPDTGTTTRETDYVNIMINSRGLRPGYYSENILFSSNGGTAVIEVSLQVLSGKAAKTLNIYRYVRGSDYLFTANPELESQGFLRRYKREGNAFRLFNKGTPGTTEFFRWYNSSKGDHFYSYERDGGGKLLKGYAFEGSIGNIATTRLSDTKELYRWFNISSGVHFYTTDSKGEGCPQRGYKYDGIAGYVR